ncbi:MAG: hypothetical protein QXU31_05395 [Archaeoglobaceae archaeon]
MAKKSTPDKMDDVAALKFVLRKKLRYSFGLATFLYFGMIVSLFFVCVVLPRLLDPYCRYICYIPTSRDFAEFDTLLFSPMFVPIKIIFALAIALLPALSYGRGFLLSALLVSPTAIVVWHFAMASIGLEKLGVQVEDLNVLLSPLGLVDGILVIIPAFAIGTLFTLALENMNKDRMSLKPALGLALIPVGVGLALSVIQWGLII